MARDKKDEFVARALIRLRPALAQSLGRIYEEAVVGQQLSIDELVLSANLTVIRQAPVYRDPEAAE